MTECCTYIKYKGEKKMKDNVNHPTHYTSGKIECIDALESATTGLTGIEAVCTANVIKYLWRWKQKNGTEDLRKARWYLDRLIAVQEDTPTITPDAPKKGCFIIADEIMERMTKIDEAFDRVEEKVHDELIHDAMKFVADHRGLDTQMITCAEELSELIQALSKLRRKTQGQYPETDLSEFYSKVEEEIADVAVMIDQVMYLLDLDFDAITEIHDAKILREKARIEAEQLGIKVEKKESKE